MIATALAAALGGRRAGLGWMARCPAHKDHSPSLAITEAAGRILIHCHAGCRQEDVIAVLRARGLWASPNASASTPKVLLPDPADEQRAPSALRIWNAAKPLAGTLAVKYLSNRGITIAPPFRLRFAPALRHPSQAIFPALIGLVSRGEDDQPTAIHRTFLSHDGSGKASVSPAKMMLGPCRGGAVRLEACGPHLLVAEGLETCLSAIQATGLPGWAALSASGLRSLELPSAVGRVTILADGDPAGEAAAVAAADRWAQEGRTVSIARAPRGKDFNDLLRGHQ